MADDDGTGKTEETFTRAQVRAMIGAEVKKVRDQYADYDDLKARAAEADKSKTAIERIEAKLDETTKRAEKAERESLVREVADELGVSVRMARKFDGKTREEMLADGRDTLSDMGIEPDKTKRKAKTSEVDDEDGGAAGSDEDGEQQTAGRQDDARSELAPPARRQRRPVEQLRSGAPATPGKTEETDPLKLVADVRL
jgi:hypothetical protein